MEICKIIEIQSVWLEIKFLKAVYEEILWIHWYSADTDSITFVDISI